MWSFVGAQNIRSSGHQVVQGRRALRDSIKLAREPSLSVVGQTIGSYSILRQLGAGAMGEVYLAEHRHLKRKAALKLLAPGLVGRPDLLERFFLEARATSAIAHAGIVQIFDCEIDATGRPYIVMEYLDGDTLAAALVKHGPLTPAPAARLTRSMAEALEAAHAKGIVHRDLKPENVFVLVDPPDSAKLVDFGIAKLAGDFRAAQVHQTRTGAMMGTPLYMSPEQCRDSANIDHRTDMYSLGCVLFEMLTGRPPFTHDALGELIVAHMTAPAPDARAIRAGIPAALAELANDLLKKNPAERPTMRQVSERMTAFIAGLTTVPGPDGEAAAARAAARPPKATTFGNAASELVTDTVTEVERPRKRGRAVALVLAAAAILVGGGVFASRALRSDAPSAATATVASLAPLTPLTPATAKTMTTKAKATATAASATPPIARPSGTTAASAADGERPSSKDRSSQRPAVGGKRAGMRRLSESKGVAPEPRPAEPAPSPSPSAAASAPMPVPSGATPRTTSELTGTWEGPWNDPAKQQSGRLQLQIGADGAVSGWMTNAAARQSYRMVGRIAPGGRLDLACQCPRDQVFWARGTLRAAGGDVKGQLTLQSATAVFGQSQVTLRSSLPR